MKRTIGLVLAAVFAIGVWMPIESSAQTWRTRTVRRTTVWNPQRNSDWRDRQWRSREWRNRRFRNTYGYRNYGQYRRTQVGNRRFRMERQYYYRNGRRLSRTVRIYF